MGANILADVLHQVQEGSASLPKNATVVGIRKELIAALELLLNNPKHPEWASDPKVSSWYIDLGGQYILLSREVTGHDRVECYKNGTKAYFKASEVAKGNNDAKTALFAQHMALDMKSDLLSMMAQEKAPAAELNTLGSEHSNQLKDFVDAVKAALKTETDKEYIDKLTEWGAGADFDKAVVMYEYCNSQADALKLLDDFPKVWSAPAAHNAVRNVTDYEIRKHMERGELQEAFNHLMEYSQQWPKEADALMQRAHREDTRPAPERQRREPGQAPHRVHGAGKAAPERARRRRLLQADARRRLSPE